MPGAAAQALLDIGEAYTRQALAHPAQFRRMFGPMLADAAKRYAPSAALAGWSLSHGCGPTVPSAAPLIRAWPAPFRTWR